MHFLAATICLMVCHGGPAAHFADFARALEERGHHVEIYAAGPAYAQLVERGVQPHEFVIEPGAEEKLVSLAKDADVVLTDIGHPFAETVQRTLKEKAPQVKRLAYYDNPESFVPGGYSEVAARVAAASEGVLFANGRLANVCMLHPKQFPVGYFPMARVNMMRERRAAEKTTMQKQFFAQHNLSPRKVLVYFGGNNEVYFSQALPACLEHFTRPSQQLPPFVFVFQQHPGAKAANRDRVLVEQWARQHPEISVVISELKSDDAQVLADVALYYQTSMGPQWALSGIPAVQVGHEVYPDVLVRGKLVPTAVTGDELVRAVAKALEAHELSTEPMLQELGIDPDWAEKLSKLFL